MVTRHRFAHWGRQYEDQEATSLSLTSAKSSTSKGKHIKKDQKETQQKLDLDMDDECSKKKNRDYKNDKKYILNH